MTRLSVWVQRRTSEGGFALALSADDKEEVEVGYRLDRRSAYDSWASDGADESE
jgi:hypothetical protein